MDGIAASETGMDAAQRLRPDPIFSVKLLDLLPDVRSADQSERAGKSLVIVHQRLIKVKNVHLRDPLATNSTANVGKVDLSFVATAAFRSPGAEYYRKLYHFGDYHLS